MAQMYYSEEEAREILKRAVTLEGQQTGFTREQLEELAEELDISRDALERAEQAWRAEQEEPLQETKVHSAPTTGAETAERASQGTEPAAFTLPVGKIILFFILMSVLGGWGSGWFLAPLFFWGLFAFGFAGWGCGRR